VLIYAVVSIRMVIGKYGLSKRVNYRMFLVNAIAMGLYVLSVVYWYTCFYMYCEDYYGDGLEDPAKR
jgi:hypothetical protein